MVVDRAVSKQSGKQCKGMIRQCRINEWFLPFQSFSRAAARLVISVELGSDNFREEL